MAISLDLAILFVIPPTILLAYFLNRKYKLYDTWIATIKKLAPLFLIFFPAFITYFLVCGTFSALVVAIYTYVIGRDHIVVEEFLMYEKAVEYTCSFLIPLLYFKILSKQNFPSFWAYIITLVHMLVAGYRDAKLIYTPAVGDAKAQFESGPKILMEIQWMDAMIPLLSFLLFYFLLRNKWKYIPSTEDAEQLNELKEDATS